MFKKKKDLLFTPLICFIGLAGSAEAEVANAISLKSPSLDTNEGVNKSSKRYYREGVKNLEEGFWDGAVRNFTILATSFPNDPNAQDAWYYVGLAEFYADELDAANDAFSAYLKGNNHPKFFEETFVYKFAIAEKFNEGAKRRFFGNKKLPKLSSGKSMAIQTYDEVIAALPCHDLAARSFFAKGGVLWEEKRWKDSIESYQMVIKRFPKHELAPESYVAISKVYRERSKIEFQNPDVLAFAEINLRRFKQDYPKEQRVAEVESDLLAIKEMYAAGLYETGQFYERTNRARASIIYYQNVMKKFPETKVAEKAQARLKKLNALPSV